MIDGLLGGTLIYNYLYDFSPAEAYEYRTKQVAVETILNSADRIVPWHNV